MTGAVSDLLMARAGAGDLVVFSTWVTAGLALGPGGADLLLLFLAVSMSRMSPDRGGTPLSSLCNDHT